MKRFLIVALAAGLSSCAGAKYAMDNYSNVKMVSWTSPTLKKGFLVYDKPAENRMMISLGMGGAMAQGMGQGLTLGAVDTRTPEIIFQDAAIEWLASQGRACRSVNAFVIIEPQYEVRYECSPVIAPANAPQKS